MDHGERELYMMEGKLQECQDKLAEKDSSLREKDMLIDRYKYRVETLTSSLSLLNFVAEGRRARERCDLRSARARNSQKGEEQFV